MNHFESANVSVVNGVPDSRGEEEIDSVIDPQTSHIIFQVTDKGSSASLRPRRLIGCFPIFPPYTVVNQSDPRVLCNLVIFNFIDQALLLAGGDEQKGPGFCFQ